MHENMVPPSFRLSCETRRLEGVHDRSLEFQLRPHSFACFPLINRPGISKFEYMPGQIESFETAVGRTSYRDASALDIQINHC